MNRQWLYHIVSKTNTISGLSSYRLNKLKLRNFSCLRMLHSMIDMRSMSSYPSNFNFISRLKFCFFFIYAFSHESRINCFYKKISNTISTHSNAIWIRFKSLHKRNLISISYHLISINRSSSSSSSSSKCWSYFAISVLK